MSRSHDTSARARIALLSVLSLLAILAWPALAGADVNGAGPDETPAQAYGPLQLNAPVSGAFTDSSDEDYLAFTVARAGQTLDFTLQNTTASCADPNGAGCPVYATLMDSSGQNQVGGDQSAAGTIATSGDTETFAWTFAQAGTYYVLLESNGDLPAGSPSYRVTLTAPSGTGSSTSGGTPPPLVRACTVPPRQHGYAVAAKLVLGQVAARVRALVLMALPHGRSQKVAAKTLRGLSAGTHRFRFALSPVARAQLKRGRRLSLSLRLSVVPRSGAAVTCVNRLTLTRG